MGNKYPGTKCWYCGKFKPWTALIKTFAGVWVCKKNCATYSKNHV